MAGGRGAYTAPAPRMWDSSAAAPGAPASRTAAASAREAGAGLAAPGVGPVPSAAGAGLRGTAGACHGGGVRPRDGPVPGPGPRDAHLRVHPVPGLHRPLVHVGDQDRWHNRPTTPCSRARDAPARITTRRQLLVSRRLATTTSRPVAASRRTRTGRSTGSAFRRRSSRPTRSCCRRHSSSPRCTRRTARHRRRWRSSWVGTINSSTGWPGPGPVSSDHQQNVAMGPDNQPGKQELRQRREHRLPGVAGLQRQERPQVHQLGRRTSRSGCGKTATPTTPTTSSSPIIRTCR